MTRFTKLSCISPAAAAAQSDGLRVREYEYDYYNFVVGLTARGVLMRLY